jgi:sodium/potassium-transporting ATPase subunit alpha
VLRLLCHLAPLPCAAYETLGAMGERLLGFAYREITELPLDYPFTNKPESNFEFQVGGWVGGL